MGLICLAACLRMLAAEEPATNVVVVSPQYVNAIAEQMRTNSPALAAARTRLEGARHNVQAIRGWEDPMVRVGGIGARTSMRADEGDLLYGVEQKLPLSGKPKLARAEAQAAVAVAQASADYVFQGLRRDLARLLFRAALAERVIEIGSEDLAWLAAMVETAERRYLLGEATQVQVLRLQNEQSRRADQLLTDRQRRAQEWAALNRLLNQSVETRWPPLALAPIAGPVPFGQKLIDFALIYEPKLKVLRRQIKQAEAGVAMTRRQQWPEVSVGAEARNYTGSGEFRQGMLTLSFNLPWINRGHYRSDIRREEAQLKATEYEVTAYELAVREEVFRLTVDLDAARRRALLYRDELLPRSEQALRSAEESWRSTRGSLNDALEARRMILEARMFQAQAVAEQYQLLSDLVLCCGLADLEALRMIGAQPDAK